MPGRMTMEPRKTLVCTYQKCGNEAEMTIKCEEVVLESKPAKTVAPVEAKPAEKTMTCTKCGYVAKMIDDL
jgi:hypothetical protein